MRETNYNYHQIVRIAIIAITLFIQYSCIDGENGNHNNNNNNNNNNIKNGEGRYVSFVTIPIFSHFEPLAAMAEKMYERGYRVSIALPEGYESWVETYAPHAQFIPCGILPHNEELEELQLRTFLSPTNTFISSINSNKNDSSRKIATDPMASTKSSSIPNVNNSTSIRNTDKYFLQHIWDSLFPYKNMYINIASRLRYYAAFQKNMLTVLTHAHAIDVPDLIVVDRYTFAGIGSANYHHINFVINSPSLLYDIDNPAQYIPAPFSPTESAHSRSQSTGRPFKAMDGTTASHLHTNNNDFCKSGGINNQKPSINDRVKNYLHRLVYRLAVGKATGDINAVWNLNVDSNVINEDQYYKKKYIIVNSIFGIDDERDLSPLITMVGDISIERNTKDGMSVQLIDDIPEQIHDQLFDGGTNKHFTSGTNNILVDLNGYMSNELKTILEEKDNFLLLEPAGSGSVVEEDDMDEIHSPILLQDVFNSLNVSILITTGKLSAVQKAFLNCIPVIIMPITAEDLDIGKRIEHLSAGVLISANHVSSLEMETTGCLSNGTTSNAFKACVMEKMIQNAILKINNDKVFRRTACKLKSKLLAGGGLHRAANILEAAITIGVAPYINIDLPWYSKSMLDVYLLYSIVLGGVYMILKTMMSACSTLWESVVNPSVAW